ncbi:glycosyltransferase family 8 protein [Candidatus Enterococcus ferrettii]|uniref:General stress protein A n=1 Tax=Candidatus Enterococcus ferrettii TaxID=2815324 RepID=A0ABV0EYI5_9ENTE|nr:glycosyltransferase family 8 protein [Enterococcus sp. 665A]MBO1339378.1 glycosyltransferase family 8 protein [Enterococcus sp. 665A]
MSKERITIVSSSNAAFAPHVSALFVSILENCKNKQATFDFYVIDDNIDYKSKQLMLDTMANYQATLQFLNINKKYFKNVVESDRIPQTAYFRIAIPELFRGKKVDKLLYLDCDMIAVTDIDELWKMDLGNYTLAAVEDAGFHNRLELMGIDTDSKLYFNSGLMLINVKKWLDENVTRRVLDFIKNNPEKLKFHDQDALNAILLDQWLPLHPQWNAQSYIMKKEVTHPNPTGEKTYEETRKAPSIIHFSGHVKPWSDEFTSPLKGYYLKYARKTAFSKKPLYKKNAVTYVSTTHYGKVAR